MSAELRGRLDVMADMLDVAAKVIADLDHDEAHGALLERMQAAVRAVRMDGVGIDAVHRGGLLDGAGDGR